MSFQSLYRCLIVSNHFYDVSVVWKNVVGCVQVDGCCYRLFLFCGMFQNFAIFFDFVYFVSCSSRLLEVMLSSLFLICFFLVVLVFVGCQCVV